MRPAKARSVPFPYLVALAIFLVNLIIDAVILHSVIRLLPGDLADDPAALSTLQMVIAGLCVGMVFSVAVGLAGAQWLGERRGAGLPWYVAASVAVIHALLAAAFNYGWQSLLHGLMTGASWAQVQWLVFVGGVLGRVVTVVTIMLPLWVAFRVFRARPWSEREVGSLRWRSVLVFVLLVWAWHLLLLQWLLPATMAASKVYGIDPGFSSLWINAGSLIFVMPAFIAALMAWPENMPSARVPRALFASVLATVATIVSMLAIALGGAGVLSILRLEIVRTWATGASLVMTVLWLGAATWLCLLVAKMLMRHPPKAVLDEPGYQLGESSE
ncbi:hypothetical protein [Dyella choica]|uniref:Uncharacterized protein n=1 Tax=Dyella choica TaxID=1927959 RepID=A0A3S0Q383_9GAMM|nr:hypothetical protein [Dyella choica]RUL72698.1 hypothetical protein EKH80_16810 [Dyella choica]